MEFIVRITQHGVSHLLRALPICAALALQPGAAHCNHDWVWLGGMEVVDQPNMPTTPTLGQTGYPGARSGALHWTDKAGNLWLYGGRSGGASNRADFWKYSPTLETWTYMGGDATGAPAVYPAQVDQPGHPGERSNAVCWVDPKGNLNLFGGRGRAANSGGVVVGGLVNDLWCYEIASDRWVWKGGGQLVSGAGQYGSIGQTGLPRARVSAGYTVVGNHLYLYGGSTVTQTLHDFWRLDITAANLQWVLLGGDGTGDNPGIIPDTIGEVGYPGSREGAMMWPSGNQGFSLMGGIGPGAVTPGNFTNDVWFYETGSAQWTLQAPNSPGNFPSTYHQQGVPGRRMRGAVWSTPFGTQIFGGSGLFTNNLPTLFNDHWINDGTNKWLWVDGSDSRPPARFYPAAHGMNGTPYGRYGSSYWYEPVSQKLYLFGGQASVNGDYTHDFWVRDANFQTSAVGDWQLWD